jgi:hypothetical protein
MGNTSQGTQINRVLMLLECVFKCNLKCLFILSLSVWFMAISTLMYFVALILLAPFNMEIFYFKILTMRKIDLLWNCCVLGVG